MGQLSRDHIDVLCEVFNMGIGRAVEALSHLGDSHQEITFELPDLRLISGEEFVKRFESQEDKYFVLQRYFGAVEGAALMYYPGDEGQKLAALLIDESIPYDEVGKLESDAVVEIGNIFINAALSSLSDFLGIEIHTQIPELLYQNSVSEELLEKGSHAIEIEAKFNAGHLGIHGKIAFLLSNKTLDMLIRVIDQGL